MKRAATWIRNGAVLLIALASTAVAQAGLVSYDFDSGLPAGTSVYGTATANSGVLKLTEASNGQQGSFIVGEIDPGEQVVAFSVHYQLQMGPGTSTPADGSGFNFANDLPAGSFGEEGAGTGITIAFDTYNNGGGEAPAIDLKFGGTTIQHTLNNPYTNGEWYDVDIRLDPDGTLDLVFNGTAIFTDVATGYTPITGGQFGFGGRTGGLNQANYIDNLVISTATPEPSTVAMLAGLSVAGLLGYFRSRRKAS